MNHTFSPGPPSRPKTALLPICIAVICAAAVPAWALDPAKAPGGNFDLSHWKLTLPVDKSGGTNGTPREVSAVQLVGGQIEPPYVQTGSDGAMVFWCPAVGANAGISTHPRTELRELIDSKSADVNWTGDGTHILTAQCKVNNVAPGCRTAIGQVHGKNVDIPLVIIRYDNRQNQGMVTATVKYKVDDKPIKGDTDKMFTFAHVSLNEVINYQIMVTNGVANITVNGQTQSQDFYATDPNWRKVDFYFKAGNYYVDNGRSTNSARVSFYALTTRHEKGEK